MPNINSTFKLQDKASGTLKNVSKGLGDVIDKSKQLEKNANPRVTFPTMQPTGPAKPKVVPPAEVPSTAPTPTPAPAATTAASTSNRVPEYSEAQTALNAMMVQHDVINHKIELMARQEKMVVEELKKEQSALVQNDKAILKQEQKLSNIVDKKNKLINQSDQLTFKINNEAEAMQKVANNAGKVKMPQEKVTQGFSNWQAKLVTINQGLQLAGTLARGVGGVMNFSDGLARTKARLDLINDGQQTTAELQDKIFYAAQRSRGSYEDMSKTVAKLGILAGDSFKSNDEMIAFSETLNKTYKISGAGAREMSAATYQLSQAMASGRLQGDEFRSILENAPMLAQAIGKELGKGPAELKKMSSEGKITSDVIKRAMFNASDEVNAKFNQLPKTFADASQSIQNVMMRAFTPISTYITKVLNSETFANIMKGIEMAIYGISAVIMGVLNVVGMFIDFMTSGSIASNTMIAAVAAYAVVVGVGLIPVIDKAVISLIKYVAAWVAANWQMTLVMLAIGLVTAVLIAMQTPLEILVGIIGAIALAWAAYTVAQWAANASLEACPIVWLAVLIVGVIVAIIALMNWIAELTGAAESGFGMITGAIWVVAMAFVNLGLLGAGVWVGIFNGVQALAANMITAFDNAIKSVQGFFYGLMSTAMEVIAGIAEALNSLPFVTIDFQGIKNQGKSWAAEKAKTEGSKGQYKDVLAEFNKGIDSMGAFKGDWAGEAYKQGSSFGDGISKAVGGFNPQDLLGGGSKDTGGTGNKGNKGGVPTTGGGNVPVDLKKNSDKEVDISDEDLKMLKDIATKDYMLNYKQITPNVNISFGDVRETADVNKLADELSKMMADQLTSMYVVEEG